MNEEEFKKALEIIHNPIIVNSVEYKYFDKENYNKLEEIIRYSDYLYKKVRPYVEYQEEKINKQKEVLDDIKENLKNIDFEYLRLTNNHCLADYLERLLELLEEIE